MTPRFLLDTNIVSDLVRRPQGKAATRALVLDPNQIRTSIIVAAELRFGSAKLGSSRLTTQLEAVLSVIEIVPWAAPADTRYGILRAELERTGQVIGANDMLIAAHALTLGCTLVTDNEREFARVPGLEIVNWLR